MKQLSRQIRSNAYLIVISGFLLLCVTVFLMPFPRSWSLYPLGLSMVAGLILWIGNYKNLRQSFFIGLSHNLPPLLYFLIILLNDIFRTPELRYLEGYFMFLLVPIFCFPLFSSQYFNDRKELFIKSFILGILIICLFEFLRAVTGWEIGGSATTDISFDPDSYTSPFRSQKLSFLEHPTYLSMKVLFALTIMILFNKELKMRKSILFLIIALFVLYIYCLSSRTGLITLMLLFIYLTFKLLRRNKRLYYILLLIPLALYGTYRLSITNPRIENKTNELLRKYKEGKIKFIEIDPRFTSWFASVQLIKDHPLLGVGINSRGILAEEYRKNGYNNEANLRLNAHNQFLETQLALGIPGSLVLLWMLFAPLFRKAELWKPALYYSFLIILIIAFMFESVLVRQWGIMFYTIFYCFQVNMRPVAENTLDK